MKFVEVVALPNGAHRNQTIMGEMETPEGWAVIQEEMEIPETFPFVRLTVRKGVVKKMEPAELPEEGAGQDAAE